MTDGSKAFLIVGGIWAALGLAGWYASRANDARDREHPHVWVSSEGSDQQYDVLELHDRDGRFIGFDLESLRVRFSDCTPPTTGDVIVRCMDTTGKRWELDR